MGARASKGAEARFHESAVASGLRGQALIIDIQGDGGEASRETSLQSRRQRGNSGELRVAFYF